MKTPTVLMLLVLLVLLVTLAMFGLVSIVRPTPALVAAIPSEAPPPADPTGFDLQCDNFMLRLLDQPKYGDAKHLSRYEAKVFSQHGEDGILAEIFRRVGTTNRTFVEFGSADGQENNTALLLVSGWSGLWMDGDEALIQAARKTFAKPISRGQLKAERQFVTAENIESLLDAAQVPGEPDLLSVDIDRNDYWVWEAITSYRPRVVVIEYNAIYPPGTSWVVPYSASASWDETSHFGASLEALEALGQSKGYQLVGCDLAGVNAFFVRSDVAGDRFCAGGTEHHYEPPRYYLVHRTLGHPRRAVAD